MKGNTMIIHKAIVVGLCALTWSWSGAQSWQQSFNLEGQQLATAGENTYSILKPGYQLTLDGKGRERLVVTVLPDTINIGGIDTRVVEERETKGDQLVEVSRNYFAISQLTGDVYYFGEDVDMYKHGRVDSHDGSWRHGTNGAKFGLLIPGKPAVGQRFYQELAPKVAMDRAEVVSLNERVRTAAGVFEGCLKTKETTPLEMLAREFKVYAPGIGLVKDGSLELTSHGYVQRDRR
jgi:hypothetical protein